MSRLAGEWWGHVEYVTESGVVFVVVTCRRVVGPRGVCYREWSSVRCRDLPESSGWTIEVWMGCLRERTGSLSPQSKRGSDVFEVADESTIIVGCLGH